MNTEVESKISEMIALLRTVFSISICNVNSLSGIINLRGLYLLIELF